MGLVGLVCFLNRKGFTMMRLLENAVGTSCERAQDGSGDIAREEHQGILVDKKIVSNSNVDCAQETCVYSWKQQSAEACTHSNTHTCVRIRICFAYFTVSACPCCSSHRYSH